MHADQVRPSVLLITRNLPPLIGGMERLMLNLADGLANYTQLTVIGPRGCYGHLPEGVTVVETSAKLVPFLLASTWLATRICRKTSFDLIIGGSGIIAPTLSFLSLVYGRKTAIFLHGLDLVINNYFYENVFIPRIKKIDKVIVNSRNTKHIAIEKGVPRDCITVINPGTNLPDLPTDKAMTEFVEKYCIRFEKIMIFVGRMTKRKGLSRFIQYSLPAIMKSCPTAGLVVVGENPNDSLNKLGEQEEVFAQVQRLDNKERVVFLGKLSDSDLTTCYTIADVQILPLIEVPGDIEGFGMVAIEAAACGTPTVAFDLGGVSDAISAGNGRLAPPKRYDLFTDLVTETLKTAVPGTKACISHAQNFSWHVFNDKVKKVIAPFS